MVAMQKDGVHTQIPVCVNARLTLSVKTKYGCEHCKVGQLTGCLFITAPGIRNGTGLKKWHTKLVQQSEFSICWHMVSISALLILVALHPALKIFSMKIMNPPSSSVKVSKHRKESKEGKYN